MSKPLWAILLFSMGILALWRGVTGGVALWSYLRLSTTVPAQVMEIKIVPKRSKYALKAVYSYGIHGRVYTKKTFLKGPYYLSRHCAEEAISQIDGMHWSAFVDPRDPKISALENPFPFKKVFYGACLLSVFFYFIYLKFYIESLKNFG